MPSLGGTLVMMSLLLTCQQGARFHAKLGRYVVRAERRRGRANRGHDSMPSLAQATGFTHTGAWSANRGHDSMPSLAACAPASVWTESGANRGHDSMPSLEFSKNSPIR